MRRWIVLGAGVLWLSCTGSSGAAARTWGRILTVGHMNVLVIDLGGRDGLRVGDRLDVYRGDTQERIGGTEVLKVQDDWSSSTNDSSDKRKEFLVGDRVEGRVADPGR